MDPGLAECAPVCPCEPLELERQQLRPCKLSHLARGMMSCVEAPLLEEQGLYT